MAAFHRITVHSIGTRTPEATVYIRAKSGTSARTP